MKITRGKRVTERRIRNALRILTDAIGCYGERIENPISLHWGNGVVLRQNGIMISGGTLHVAKRIAAISLDLQA